MAVEFTPRVFFLQVPNELLKSYFESRDELRGFAWERFSLADEDPLHEAWSELPERSREETDGELRAVHEMAARDGWTLIEDEAREQGLDLAAELDPREDLLIRAFRVFLKYRRVFDVARQLRHVDRLNGRYWRRRVGVPATLPDVSPEARRDLGGALSAYYRPEGRGGFCDVHAYRRGARTCYVAYPEDTAETVLGYESGRLAAKRHKFAFEVVYVLDPAAGTLDLHARGDKEVHADLQQIFARTVLKTDLPPESGVAVPFRLDHLKRRGVAFPTEQNDLVRHVRLKALRLAVLGGGRLIFDAGPMRDGIDVHDLMERSLGGQRLPLANVNVAAATMQMVFAWPDGQRTLTFDVRPDRCTLHDAPEELVARKYLRRWEIACA